jgi:hypothetical protein
MTTSLQKNTAIPADQVGYKKKIGKLGDSDVWELGLKGGLHLVVVSKGGSKAETLGVGPHRAVARHIARKRAPDMKITELSKADHVDVEHFAVFLPKWEAVTEKLRERERQS